MADPDEVSNEDDPTKPSLRRTATGKTKAVRSATADVVRDAFDKVIESIDSVATQQQHNATTKEEKSAAKQERKAQEKAAKAAAKLQRQAAEGGAEPPTQP